MCVGLIPSLLFLPPPSILPPSTLQGSTSPSNGGSRHSESFIEALKNTEQTVSSLSLVRSQSPLQVPEIIIERLTDYPGHLTSPSPSPGSIRRLSLSVSESSLTSSLTSEGSVGFDRSKRPKKQILKKPHGPRKHKSNRVRWNIPEEAEDTLSMESFESSSTASSLLYQQARNSVNESRQNWREFEEAPPPGSTGLTPAKPTLSTLRENRVDTGYMQGDQSPSSLSPPRSPLARSQRHSTRNGTDIGRSVSPLQYSTHMSSPTLLDQNTSTPVCDTNPRRVHEYNHVNGTGDSDSTHNQFDSAPLTPPTSVPLLKLDHSNLSELEASTLEDRLKSNLFEIPHAGNTNSPDPHTSTEKISTSPAYSGYIPPGGMAHLCGGSDADDYDHLSPRRKKSGPQLLTSPTPPAENRTARFDFCPPVQMKKSSDSQLSPPPPPPTENGTTHDYGDSDIDEALNELEESMNSHSSSTAHPPTSDTPEPFSRRRLLSVESELRVAEHHEKAATTAVQKGSGDYEPPRPELAMQPFRSLSVPPHTRDDFQHKNQQMAGSSKKEDAPPPVPPKLYKWKSTSPPMGRLTSTQSSLSPSSSTGTNETGRTHTQHVPDIVAGPAQVVVSSNLSQEEACEDAMSSISNATLVPEPGESSPPNSLHLVHSTAPNTPKQRTKFDQANDSGGREKGGVSNYTDSSSTRVPPIHPEPSSSLTRQSWDHNGTTSSTRFAHHPPPQLYRHEPQSYTQEQLPPIDEPQRQSIITVSNSGSDSSLRGASPPDKVSQAIIQMHPYGQNHYLVNKERKFGHYPSSSQSPSSRLISAQVHSSGLPPPATHGGQIFNSTTHTRKPPIGNSGSNIRNFPPQFNRKQVSLDMTNVGGNLPSRNHRLYHSQRSALAPRSRQRMFSGSKEGGSGNFWEGSSGVEYQQGSCNPRGVLKFHAVNSFETPLEEIRKMRRSQSPPYHSKALSQDDQFTVAAFYPGGLGQGHGINLLADVNEKDEDRLTTRKLYGIDLQLSFFGKIHVYSFNCRSVCGL